MPLPLQQPAALLPVPQELFFPVDADRYCSRRCLSVAKTLRDQSRIPTEVCIVVEVVELLHLLLRQ